MITSVWMLVQFGLWFTGAEPGLEIHSTGDVVLLLVQSIYQPGFGCNLLLSGYVALLFWVIAAAILFALPVSAGLFT